ncbi:MULTISPECIES: hypothetical protein [Pseudomonas]|uniref:Uncharacterized protein n=1 Tax=Pseudomonas fluorescens TaxID=294 RepID=A0A166QNR7_PSEFL|nr:MULTISPECIES: hypothetical protein [Pseudomonas]KZN20601.1 hypothetical protein A1D17_03415 [Pseudomonas fluorescens]
MTGTAGILRGIVRGGLTPGPHDALIEMRGQQSHRIANHLILNIGEACVERWPLTVADYNQPLGTAELKVPVKFTVRNDMYPRLYQRYKSLAPAVRTTVFLNMLNRYAELARIDPGAISAALRDLAQGQPVAQVAESAASNDAQRAEPASSKPSAPAVEVVASDVRLSEPENLADPDPDPLNDIDSGL